MAGTAKTTQPYGTWPSQVTAGLISNRSRLNEVRWASDGQTMVWHEGRSSSNVLVAADCSWPVKRDLTDEQSPRGGVGYGGGAFDVAKNQPVIVFANGDGRLYRRELSPGRPKAITPVIGPSGAVASPAISPDGQWVAYIHSDGSTDVMAVTPMEGATWPVQLARGADFYMQPVWHPAGTHLAWVEWDHPNMPWDGARIMLAKFESNPPRLIDPQAVGGGQYVPAQQPEFSPDGKWLSFVEENGEWADLILLDLHSGGAEYGERRVLVRGEGFDINPPAWVQGVRSYGWNVTGERIYQIRQQGSVSSLWVVDVASGDARKIDTAPYTWLSQLAVSGQDDRLAFLASAPGHPDVVVMWDGHMLHRVAFSTSATFNPTDLPAAREIAWVNADGSTAYGLYFAPSNPRYSGVGLPPAIVQIHGGPTSYVAMRFNAEAAYFTSRGYAYVAVNYRGSTGYGRSYRHAMRGRWGDVDVEDAAGCARALAEQQLADSRRLVITGGSAGGYTVLNTLIRHPGLFKAGVCQYGVTNLFALNMDTHKFEAHYNDTMVGPLPEATERYHAWSPVFHAAKIQDALYIFQGKDDVVVPPSQAEEIVAALRSNGVPHKYKVYEGEGHGFRKAETIADYLKETERFLVQNVIFAP